MPISPAFAVPQSPPRQRGVATLMVALVILVILTVIVLASTNVALFEQRTATNENRQRLADQVAKYSLDLGGEFVKANITNVASAELSGWLATNTKRWIQCSTVMDGTTKEAANLSDGSPHPCMAEPSPARRALLYFYSYNDALTTDDTLIPYQSLVPTAGKITTAGGAFAASAKVRALLCRIDTTLVADDGDPATVDPVEPDCRLTPVAASQNRIAVTIISSAQLDNESAAAQVKETWASFNSVATSSTVPLVASGSVNGTGNVTIVADPDGAGYGLPVSIWTVDEADVDKTAGGSAASVSTCQLGDFLNKPYRDHGDAPTLESELKTTCVTDNTACGCPAAQIASSDFLSGKVPGGGTACCENVDILDVDCGKGSPNAIPDIQFFPGQGFSWSLVGTTCTKGAAKAYDKPLDVSKSVEYNASAAADDSLFEWVFGVDGESVSRHEGGTGQTLTTCGAGAENCATWYLTQPDQLNAEQVTCAQMNAIAGDAAGLYYVTDSPCTFPKQIGSPDAQAIVVVNDDARLNNTNFYGLLFVRSNTKSATFRGNGNATVIGSVVVEGSTDITGGLTIIYDPTQASAPGKKLPRGTRLGRVSGSWLDNNQGGF
jgi:hypothetical protein